MRVLILKGNRLYADAVACAAERACEGAQITVCLRGSEVLALLREEPAHLGLFGLTLPDCDGLDILARVSEERLISRILVISGRNDETVRRGLLESRVNGFFDTTVGTSAELVEAIRRVHTVGHYFTGSIGVRGDTDMKRVPDLRDLLSAAEQAVFATICDGSDDQTAALQLGLNYTTVHTHRQRIMRKLGVRTRAELMQQAIQRGLVRFTSQCVIRPGFDRMLTARRKQTAVRVG